MSFSRFVEPKGQAARRVRLALVLIAALAGCAPSDPVATISPTEMLATPIATAAPAPAEPTMQAAPTVRPAPTSAPPPAPTTAPTLPPTTVPTMPPTPSPEPGADFARAMRPEFAGDIVANSQLPQYDLRISIDTGAGVLTGTEQIAFTNLAGVSLGDIALRLYPNFPQDVFGKGGDVRMDVTGAAIDGASAEIEYAAQRTAVLLALPRPLEPGAATTLSITYTATIRPWRDGSWPLPSYYPMLAAHDSAGWRLDVTQFADHVYAESALYAAEVTVPAGLSLAATGSTIATRTNGDRGTTYSIRSGPVREFAITAGEFAVAHAQAGASGDVAVNVYAQRGTNLGAQAIARVAAAALTDFDQRFGAYPYQELDLHLLPYEYDGGDEYPGLIMLYTDGPVDAGARYVAAHEVAHQWWYGVIGNDIYRMPWLDEALAQYSGVIYAEDVAGAAVAEADWEREVLRRYRGALNDGDLQVGLGIRDYPSFNVYYRTVYGKGPVFLRMLRDELGDAAFFNALQTYYQQHRYGVATSQDLRQAFEQAAGRDLGALFQLWVGAPSAR